MLNYIGKRILQIPLVLFGIIVLTFLIVHLTPGDPAMIAAGSGATEEAVELIREEMGLNKPLFQQFTDYIGNLLKGDMGKSLIKKTAVSDSIKTAMVNTLYLVLLARIWSILAGIPLGIVAARHRNSILDKLSMGVSIIGLSLPTFFIGLISMWFFCFKLGWFPISGMSGSLFSAEGFKYVVVPAFVLGIAQVPSIANVTRSNMIEVLGQDYIRTARAKGLSQRAVVYRHALKNAAPPLITIIGMQTGYMLSGSVVVETIFSWPGIGRLSVQSILNRDFTSVQGCILVIALIFVLINLLVDIIYALVDKRIKY